MFKKLVLLVGLAVLLIGCSSGNDVAEQGSYQVEFRELRDATRLNGGLKFDEDGVSIESSGRVAIIHGLRCGEIDQGGNVPCRSYDNETVVEYLYGVDSIQRWTGQSYFGNVYQIDFYNAPSEQITNAECGEIDPNSHTLRCTDYLNSNEFNYGDVKSIANLSEK